MAAAVNVIEKDGNIKLKKINVGYCKECNVFFVLESIYEELKKWYVPICKVSDVKTYYGSNGKYGMKLAQESILVKDDIRVNMNKQFQSGKKIENL